MAAERDKFKFPTLMTAIHGTTERRITTVEHPFNIPDDRLSGMQDVFHFFIVFFKDFLEDVHKVIMKE